jgi:hypothetical protein
MRSKLAFAGLAATLLLAVAVGSANARTIRISNQTFRATWNPLRFFGVGTSLETRCPVTLEGSFHSATIAKVLRTLIGYVTAARSGTRSTGCTRGSATVHQASLPWHITYEGFTGTLPNITRIRILLRGTEFEVEPEALGLRCNFGNATENAAGEINIGTRGEANSITADNTIRLRSHGEFGCPELGAFENTTNSLTVLNSTTRITVTLI